MNGMRFRLHSGPRYTTALPEDPRRTNRREFEIFFSTNDAWNSAITDESRAEAPTWVRINPDHGDAAGDYDIRVETDPNTAEESRTAFIEITCGTNSILITITQSGTDGEDTNEPDEPNIGEQVRYWQLHKIVGRDASGSLIAEMEYTYELPAEFSKECRITGFKISAADKNGTLRPVETWQFTYEGDDCIRFSFTREIDGEQPYTQTADGTLYGYFCDVRSGGYELTSTLSGSEIETYGFDCTYGTGTFNSDKLTSISRYNSLTLEPICEKYEWEKDPWGPLEAWDNCSAVIRTLENEPNTETFRQEYGYDYDETTAWSDFIYELEGTPPQQRPGPAAGCRTGYPARTGFLQQSQQRSFPNGHDPFRRRGYDPDLRIHASDSRTRC